MTIFFVLFFMIANSAGEDLLNEMASRYSKADGIQWTMESTIYSPVFKETETTDVQFTFNPPDTFCFKSDQEEIVGIADTVWVMSKRHCQIQKKMIGENYMPTDFILKWSQRYDLGKCVAKNDLKEFTLKAHEGITPADVLLSIDKRNRIRRLSYKDASDNDVTLTIKKEKLRRSSNINLFYIHIPSGYKLVNLID